METVASEGRTTWLRWKMENREEQERLPFLLLLLPLLTIKKPNPARENSTKKNAEKILKKSKSETPSFVRSQCVCVLVVFVPRIRTSDCGQPIVSSVGKQAFETKSRLPDGCASNENTSIRLLVWGIMMCTHICIRGTISCW